MGHLYLFEFVFRCRSPFSSHLLLLTFLCWGVRFVPPAFFVNFARFEETTSLGGSRYLKVVNLIVYPQYS